MGWRDAPAQLGSGDAEIDQEMAGIRQSGGQAAAEGRPAFKWQQAPPLEHPAERTQSTQDRRKVPSYTQGSPADIQVPQEDDGGHLDPNLSWTGLPDKPPSIIKGLSTGIDKLGGAYEDYVGGPVRRKLFQDTGLFSNDPMKLMEQQDPGPGAGDYEKLWYEAKVFGTGVVTDPLTLGLGVGSGLRNLGTLAGRPKALVTAPVVQVPPAAGRTAHILPVPQQPPLVPIQDLAQQQLSDQLTSAQYSAKTVSDPQFPSLGTQPPVSTNPSRSIVRPLSHPDSVGRSRGNAPEYGTNPSGSLILKQRPGYTLTAESRSPLQQTQPPLPAERELPKTGDSIPESRVLHGRGMATAEELMMQRQNEQAARFEQLLLERSIQEKIDLAAVPPHGPDPVDQMLVQPLQAGMRGQGKSALPAEGEKTLTEYAPGKVRRFFLHAYDTLDSIGPLGRRLSDILRYSWDFSEAGAKQNFLDLIQLAETHFGSRTLGKKLSLVAGGEYSKFLNNGLHDFGVTTKQSQAMVELLEHGKALTPPGGELIDGLTAEKIQATVSPKAWETLKPELLDPRVQHFISDGWKLMTGRASNLPAVQKFATVRDMVTGKEIPVGPASIFLPHQSIRAANKEAFHTGQLKTIYNEGGYASEGLTFDAFHDAFLKIVNAKDATIKMRRFSGIEMKRFLNMGNDAKTHNRTVADSMAYYGYEVDPLRMALTHNLHTLKRSVFLEHNEEIQGIQRQLATEFGSTSKATQWVKQVIERSQGLSEREDISLKSSDAWNIASSILYPALLKGSWSQNFLLQPVHVIAQTGIRPLAEAAWLRIGKKLGMTDADIHASIERSAANFPSFMQKYHNPDGYFAQYAHTALDADLFSWSDRATRGLAGETFLVHGEHLIKQWWKDPANPKWRKSLEEGHLNVADLMKKMSAADKSTWDADRIPKAPPEYLQRYAQVMTNKMMGRTGVRSLPNWAAGEGDLQKVFMMLHRQVISNEGAMWKSIGNAPTAGIAIQRGLKYLVGAEAAGAMYQGVINYAMDNQILDPGDSMTKAFKGHDRVAFAVKSLLLGAGTMSAGLILSGMNMYQGNFGGATYGVVSPASAAFIDNLMQMIARGQYGKAALRLQPSEIVDKVARTGMRKERERQKAPMPGSSLSTGVGLSQ